MSLTVGSLFSGIGGFDLAAERVGWTIKWQVELDDYCTRVLEKHWPYVRRYRDVRTIDWADVEPVDLVCGGFPCQPHSLAGRRLAAADDRDLWPEVKRCLRTLRPRRFVGENVSGILSSDAGRFFGGILRDLAESGFDAEWDCIPASAVGAPHQRDRVWIIADAGDGRQRQLLQSVGELGSGVAADTRRDGEAQLMADAEGCGVESERVSTEGRGRLADSNGGRSHVADTDRHQQHGRRGDVQVGRVWGSGEVARYDDVAGTQWRTEPDVGRVAHGVPARVDRLRGLGNAIVPQVAQWIFERINEWESVNAVASR